MQSRQRVDPKGAGLERPVILVVEDEAMLALELEQVLITAGYKVAVAGDGSYRFGTRCRSRAAAAGRHRKPQPAGQHVRTRGRPPSSRLAPPAAGGRGHRYAPLAPQADLRRLGGPTAKLQKPIEAQHLLQRLHEAMASNSGVA